MIAVVCDLDSGDVGMTMSVTLNDAYIMCLPVQAASWEFGYSACSEGKVLYLRGSRSYYSMKGYTCAHTKGRVKCFCFIGKEMCFTEAYPR